MDHLSFKGSLIADTGIRKGQMSKERMLSIQAVTVWAGLAARRWQEAAGHFEHRVSRSS